MQCINNGNYVGRAFSSQVLLLLLMLMLSSYSLTISHWKMEVEIISTHCIKPFHPTPQHLKIHTPSLLDQFVPPVYIPIILFYASHDGDAQHSLPRRLQLLRHSLSETLTRFYPLAGTIKHKFSVDCNDRGIHYSEARANCRLIDFFQQPNLVSSLYKFIPHQPSWDESNEGAHVAMIRVTSFACGGLAVGSIVSHVIADGSATSFFLNNWAAAARKAIDHYACPNFEAPPAIFPLKADILPKDASVTALLGPFFKTGKIGARRLWFGPAAIAKLRAQGCSSQVPNPTRVEAVSVLIWKSIMAALKSDSVLISHAVNMRRKALPSFPTSYMGNFLWLAPSSSSSSTTFSGEAELLPNLVMKMRESISKVNPEFVKSLQGEGGCVRYCEALRELAEEGSGHGGGAYVSYTSWCGFGLYDVDFGWGKPAWVSTTGTTGAQTMFFNSVLLMDAPSGSGIEAWVFLQDTDMTIFEQHQELLAFAVLDPSPLQLTAP